MSDIFTKRMDNVMKHGSLGAKLVEDSNVLENRFFDTDANFRKGMLYDWNMNELEEVEFKFEKVKTYSAEGLSVEYMIHFRPNYNPEFKFKDRYYKNDGRERFGFYIDVLDRSKGVSEKWLIVGKDDRVAFDRYNALKCDWCFEWISDGKYYNAIGCVRSAQDGSINNLTEDDLGGTSVNDELSIFLPSNINVSTITLGTRFIISDNINNPWAYETIRIKDTTPLGTTKVYLKQCLFNTHRDFAGIINDHQEHDFYFDLPLDDLPQDYGGKYHMICDCIKSKGLPIITEQIEDYKLSCDSKYLYVNGQYATVTVVSSSDNTSYHSWNIFVDGEEYGASTLTDYFDIKYDEKTLSIKCINDIMVDYIVKIAISGENNNNYDFVEMEVRR